MFPRKQKQSTASDSSTEGTETGRKRKNDDVVEGAGRYTWVEDKEN